MWLVPNARADGLAAEAGLPPTTSVLVALLLGFMALVLCLGLSGALIAILAIGAAIGILAWLCLRQIGGQTGDVLGALEQAYEILILLIASVWL
jgi:adenosylcobinamide-GDP ribazoletransferase